MATKTVLLTDPEQIKQIRQAEANIGVNMAQALPGVERRKFLKTLTDAGVKGDELSNMVKLYDAGDSEGLEKARLAHNEAVENGTLAAMMATKAPTAAELPGIDPKETAEVKPVTVQGPQTKAQILNGAAKAAENMSRTALGVTPKAQNAAVLPSANEYRNAKAAQSNVQAMFRADAGRRTMSLPSATEYRQAQAARQSVQDAAKTGTLDLQQRMNEVKAIDAGYTGPEMTDAEKKADSLRKAESAFSAALTPEGRIKAEKNYAAAYLNASGAKDHTEEEIAALGQAEKDAKALYEANRTAVEEIWGRPPEEAYKMYKAGKLPLSASARETLADMEKQGKNAREIGSWMQENIDSIADGDAYEAAKGGKAKAKDEKLAYDYFAADAEARAKYIGKTGKVNEGETDRIYREINGLAQDPETIDRLVENGQAGLTEDELAEYRHVRDTYGIARAVSSLHEGDTSQYEEDNIAYIPEDDKRAFNAAYEEGGMDAAKKFLEDTAPARMAAHAAADSAYYRKVAEEGSFGENFMQTLVTFGALLAEPASSAYMVSRKLQGKYIDPNHGAFTATRFRNDTRAAIAGKIAGDGSSRWRSIASDTYQGMNSIADSALTMLLGRAGMTWAADALFATSSANSAFQDALDRGGTQEQAFWFAVASGTAEAMFEHLSLENYLKLDSVAGMTGRERYARLFRNIMSQGFTEASEEFNTELANMASDAWIMAEKSENDLVYQEAYNAAKAAGMSDAGAEHEAMKAKASHILKDRLWQSAKGGFLSGMFFGVTGTAVNSHRAAKIGNYYRNTGNVRLAVADAKMTGGDAARAAAGITQDSSAKQIGEMVMATREAAYNAMKDGDPAAETAYNTLMEGKLTEEQADTILKEAPEVAKELGYKAATATELVREAAARRDSTKVTGLDGSSEILADLSAEAHAESFSAIRQRIEGSGQNATLGAETARTSAAQDIGNNLNGKAEAHAEEVKEAVRARAESTQTEQASVGAGQQFDEKVRNTVEADAAQEDDSNGRWGNTGRVYYRLGNRSAYANEKNGGLKDAEKAVMRVAQRITEKSRTGLTVVIHDHLTENGYYNRSNNTLHLALDSDEGALTTLAHELTHYLETYDAEGYAAYKTALIDALNSIDIDSKDAVPSNLQGFLDTYGGQENLFEALIDYERDRMERFLNADDEVGKDAYRQAKRKALAEGKSEAEAEAAGRKAEAAERGAMMSREALEAEAVAHASEHFLGSEAFIERVCEEKPGTAKTIVSFIKKFAKEIRAALSENGQNAKAESRFLETQQEKMDALQKMWADALNKADNVKESGKDAGAEYSTREHKKTKGSQLTRPKMSTGGNRENSHTIKRANESYKLGVAKELGSEGIVSNGRNKVNIASDYLNSISKEIKTSNITASNLYDSLAHSGILKKKGSSSFYAEFKDVGRTLRLSKHHANANNFETETNFSVVFRMDGKKTGGTFDESSPVNAVELVYSESFLNENKERMSLLLKDMATFIKTGKLEYSVAAKDKFRSGSDEFKKEIDKIFKNGSKQEKETTAENEDIPEKPTKQLSTRERDAEYMELAAKQNRTGEEDAKLWLLVNAAARKAGSIPVDLFHQTGERFTEFNTDNPAAGAYDGQTPNGIFLKTNDHDIGVGGDYVNTGTGGKIQMHLFLNAKNILSFRNREEAVKWYEANIPGYKELEEGYKEALKPISEKVDELEDAYFMRDEMSEEEFDKKWEKLVHGDMHETENRFNKKMKALLDDYFIKGNSGYDAMELVFDGQRRIGANGEKVERVHTYIAFNKNQVKSADLVTYDNEGKIIPLSERFRTDRTGEEAWKNTDIRYSTREATAGERQAHVKNAVEEMSEEEIQYIASSLEHSVLWNFKDVSRVLDDVCKGKPELRQKLYELIEKPFNEASGTHGRNVSAKTKEIVGRMKELGITTKRQSALVQRIGEHQYQCESDIRVKADARGITISGTDANGHEFSKRNMTEKEVRTYYGTEADGIIETAYSFYNKNTPMHVTVSPYTDEMLRADCRTEAEFRAVKEAESWIRARYDAYVDEINEMLERVYPYVFTDAEADIDKLEKNLKLAETNIENQQKLVNTLEARAETYRTMQKEEAAKDTPAQEKTREKIENAEKRVSELREELGNIEKEINLHREGSKVRQNLRDRAANLRESIRNAEGEAEVLREQLNDSPHRDGQKAVTLGEKAAGYDAKTARALARLEVLKDRKEIAAAKLKEYRAMLEDGSYLRNKRLTKRTDYFHHFTEMEHSLGGIRELLKTNSEISPALAGKSQDTKPRAKWTQFLQKRNGGRYTEDAVNGLLRYTQSAEYILAMDPVIAQMRDLEKRVRDRADRMDKTSGAGKNANSFLGWMVEWTNSLAGKSNRADRFITRAGLRTVMKVIDAWNSKVKANKLLYNFSSSIVQASNLTNAVMYVRNWKAWRQGITAYLSEMNDEGLQQIRAKSNFLSQRYMETGKFDETALGNAAEFGGKLLGVLDEFSANLTWWAAYSQYMADPEAIKNDGRQFRKYTSAIDYADDITRRSHGGRGTGELPVAMTSRMLNLIAPFQVEINNTYQGLKQAIGKRNAQGIINMELGIFLFNNLTQAILGDRKLGLDFIHALLESILGFTDKDKEAKEAMYEVAPNFLGEFAAGMPYSSLITALIWSDEDERKELFGDNDPSRYGTGTIGMTALADFLAVTRKIMKGEGEFAELKWDIIDAASNLAPFGGTQAVRSLKGLDVMLKGYGKSDSGKTIQYSTGDAYGDGAAGTAAEWIQTILFGKWANPNARDYLENRSYRGHDYTGDFLMKLLGHENKHRPTLSGRQKELAEKWHDSGRDVADYLELKGVIKGITKDGDLVTAVAATEATPEDKALFLSFQADSDQTWVADGTKVYKVKKNATELYADFSQKDGKPAVSELPSAKKTEKKEETKAASSPAPTPAASGLPSKTDGRHSIEGSGQNATLGAVPAQTDGSSRNTGLGSLQEQTSAAQEGNSRDAGKLIPDLSGTLPSAKKKYEKESWYENAKQSSVPAETWEEVAKTVNSGKKMNHEEFKAYLISKGYTTDAERHLVYKSFGNKIG